MKVHNFEEFINEAYNAGVKKAGMIKPEPKENENKISVKEIQLDGGRDITDKAKKFSSWADAANYFYTLKGKKYSDAAYKIEFEDGEIIEGSIDLEPSTFWNPKDKHQDKGINPVGWHIKTFYGNLSKATGMDAKLYGPEAMKQAKKIVDGYMLDIDKKVDEAEKTPKYLGDGASPALDKIIPDLKSAFRAYLKTSDAAELKSHLETIEKEARRISGDKNKENGLWWRFYNNDTGANTINDLIRGLGNKTNHDYYIEAMEIALESDTKMRVYFS